MNKIKIIAFPIIMLAYFIYSSVSQAQEDYVFVNSFPSGAAGFAPPISTAIGDSIAVDNSGNVYVADSANRILKFTSDGVFLNVMGSYGRGAEQFRFISDIAIKDSGNIYVADSSNCRIQKLSPEGDFLKKWGMFGSANGQFLGPTGVAVDSSKNVYVVDSGNYRVQKFTSDGVFLATWGRKGTGNGLFNGPLSIAVDSSDNVYVADRGNSRIQKFSSKGVFITKFGAQGSDDGQFLYGPWGVAVDGSGNIYVVDDGNYRILKFNSRGIFMGKFGTFGVEGMGLCDPRNIAISKTGLIYVVDRSNQCVKVFRTTKGEAVTPQEKQPVTWGMVKQIELYQNYPNPFNPETWIPYQLADDGEATISIYNATGQLVRTLDLGNKKSGSYKAHWDGKDEKGQIVASGVYFYVLKSKDGFTDTNKMVLVR